MMKISNLEKLFNIVHYCIYLIDRKLHFWSNYINPFRLLLKIPYLKKRDEKLGVNRDEIFNEAWTNKESGIGIYISGGFLSCLVFFTIFSLVKYSATIADLEVEISKPLLISLGIISYLLCYILVFRNDKYLKYFDDFDKWNTTQRRINVAVSTIFIITILALFFLSAIF